MRAAMSTSLFSDGGTASHFDFESWLKHNDLFPFRELFLHHGMSTMDAISTSSPHFKALLSTPQILSDPLLITKIALAVNNLQTAYQAFKQEIAIQIERKLQHLQQPLATAAIFNHALYEAEKSKDERQLNQIRVQIQQLFEPLLQCVERRKQSVLKQFKSVQRDILAKYNKIIERMKRNEDEITRQQTYLKRQLNHLVHEADQASLPSSASSSQEQHLEHDDNMQKSSLDSIFVVRQRLLRMDKTLEKNEAKIRRLVAEKQRVIDEIHVSIDEALLRSMMQQIEQQLIVFERRKQPAKQPARQQRKKAASHTPTHAHVMTTTHARAQTHSLQQKEQSHMRNGLKLRPHITTLNKTRSTEIPRRGAPHAHDRHDRHANDRQGHGLSYGSRVVSRTRDDSEDFDHDQQIQIQSQKRNTRKISRRRRNSSHEQSPSLQATNSHNKLHGRSPSMDSSLQLLREQSLEQANQTLVQARVQVQNHSNSNFKRLDLVNMSPDKIKSLRWVQKHSQFEAVLDDDDDEHDEDDEVREHVIEAQLLANVTRQQLQHSLHVLYHYHCNEEDEKERVVVVDTIDGGALGEHDDDDDEHAYEHEDRVDSQHMNVQNLSPKPIQTQTQTTTSAASLKRKRAPFIPTVIETDFAAAAQQTDLEDAADLLTPPDDHKQFPAPDTPFYKNDENENENEHENASKNSDWHKCSDVSLTAADSSDCLLIRIGKPPRQPSSQVDCVWIKMIEVKKPSTSPSVQRTLANAHSAMRLPQSASAVTSPRTSGSLVPSTRLIVDSGQTVHLKSSVEYNFDEVVIHENGVLTVHASSKGYLLLKIKEKLEIHSHAKLNVSGLGHKGGKRYCDGDGKGGGGGCAKGYSSCGGGGGYGTFGENGRGWTENAYRENVDGIGGNIYGDAALSTIHFGSGGGGGYGSRGGNGGGIVCISCKSKIVLHENSGIYANGDVGKYYYDGCGSGGSIFIKCKTLINPRKSLCFIQAIGGAHNLQPENAGHGGNGGFGRVRIYCQNIKTLTKLKQHGVVVQPPPFLG